MFGKRLFTLSAAPLLLLTALAAAPAEANAHLSFNSDPQRFSRAIVISPRPGDPFSNSLGARRYLHSTQQQRLRQPNPFSYEHYRSGRDRSDDDRTHSTRRFIEQRHSFDRYRY